MKEPAGCRRWELPTLGQDCGEGVFGCYSASCVALLTAVQCSVSGDWSVTGSFPAFIFASQRFGADYLAYAQSFDA